MSRFVRALSRADVKKVIANLTASNTTAGGAARKAVLVDVREHDEVAHGMIPTAVHIPLGSVPAVFEQGPQDLARSLKQSAAEFDINETQLIFYCRSGVRSQQVGARGPIVGI